MTSPIIDVQAEQLSIEDKQIAPRVVALILMAMGLILTWALRPRGWVMLIFVLAGVVMLLLASDLTVTADRASQTLYLSHRSLVKHTITEIPFVEISDIYIQRSTIRRNQRTRTVFRVVLELRDGEIVPLREEFTGKLYQKEDLVKDLRTFIWTSPSA